MTALPNNSDDEQDLILAAELQAALLPRQCPNDCIHQVLAARNRMCDRVGGDFYDFIRINQDQVAVVMGDIVGHGVHAAMLMTKIMGWLQSQPETISRPIPLIQSLNRMLIDMSDRTRSIVSCSLFYGVIDAPTGLVVFVSAGHPLPYLCDRTSCSTVFLGERNILLGVEDFEPVETCITFEPGQRMVLFTDGVTDAANAQNEMFGHARLHELVNKYSGLPPQQCVDAIFDAIETFRANQPQFDDESIVILDRV